MQRLGRCDREGWAGLSQNFVGVSGSRNRFVASVVPRRRVMAEETAGEYIILRFKDARWYGAGNAGTFDDLGLRCAVSM